MREFKKRSKMMETCQMQTFMDLDDPTLWSFLTASYISRWFVNETFSDKKSRISFTQY